MKRRAVLKKIKSAARKNGLEFSIIELTNHTGVGVGPITRTIGRHSEISDPTARAFFRQFDIVLGKNWWR